MLLLDENLSPRLAARLDNDYPGIKHIVHVGLGGEDDYHIWEYAKGNGVAIVPKDKDYIDFSHQHGHPPKIVVFLNGTQNGLLVL